MVETPLDLEAIRRRHVAVRTAYSRLTGAESDRGALLVEVDRLRALNQRLQQLVQQLEEDGAPVVPVGVLARLVFAEDDPAA